METDINSPRARYVVCRDARTVWIEDRDFDATPTIGATSNARSAWTTKREAARAVRELRAQIAD